MPTGSGKLFTIINYFNKFLAKDEKVLFLNSFVCLAEQTRFLLSQSLSERQYTVETIYNLEKPDKSDDLNMIDEYDYMVIELEDFLNKQLLLDSIYQKFTGIIIGLYSAPTESINEFITKHGEISYSLKLSDELYNFLQTNKMDETDSTPQEHLYFSQSIIDTALQNKTIRELVCGLFCPKNTKSAEKQEVIIDLAAVLAGFIPVVGSIVGVAFKYLYKQLSKYILNKLKNQLNCFLCEQIK